MWFFMIVVGSMCDLIWICRWMWLLMILIRLLCLVLCGDMKLVDWV